MARKPKTKAAAPDNPVSEKHEIQAEINARHIALRQSESLAIEHMEKVIGAFLQTMEAPAFAAFCTALSRIEDITPDIKETVQLFGELSADGKQICGAVDETTGEVIKSKRQKWREELAALELQLQAAPDAPEGEGTQ